MPTLTCCVCGEREGRRRVSKGLSRAGGSDQPCARNDDWEPLSAPTHASPTLPHLAQLLQEVQRLLGRGLRGGEGGVGEE